MEKEKKKGTQTNTQMNDKKETRKKERMETILCVQCTKGECVWGSK